MTIVIVTVAAVVTKWSISLDSLYFFFVSLQNTRRKKRKNPNWSMTLYEHFIIFFWFIGVILSFFGGWVDVWQTKERKKNLSIHLSEYSGETKKILSDNTLCFELNFGNRKKSKGCRSFWMMWKNRPFFLSFVSLCFFLQHHLKQFFFGLVAVLQTDLILYFVNVFFVVVVFG